MRFFKMGIIKLVGKPILFVYFYDAGILRITA